MAGETNKAAAKPKTKAVTPPKGRPTPTRSTRYRRRTFSSTYQWVALALIGILLFVIAIMLLGGGDFNPFNDDSAAPATQLSGGRWAGW